MKGPTVTRYLTTILVAAALLVGGSYAHAEGFTPAQKTEIETIVKDVLAKSGGDIMTAVQTFQAEQQRKTEEEASKKLVDKQKDLFENPDLPTVGAKDADVNIVAFFDYNCGFCKKALPVILAVLEKDPKVQFIFVELPILGPTSGEAAKYAKAAVKQGKYWEFHQALMTTQGQKDKALFEKIAKDNGLDFAKLTADAESPEIAKMLENNQGLARDLGLSGTPAFIINDQIVRGYLDEAPMLERIKQVRDAAKKG